MQDTDILTKEYFGDSQRFADLINGFIFGGLQKVNPEDVHELDSSMDGSVSRVRKRENRKGYRDLLRKIVLGMSFAIIGVEEQSDVHYAMPVRTMLYDALSYDKQYKKIKKQHASRRDLRQAEFLSGIDKNEKLAPVITIILYFGKHWDGPRSMKDMLSLEDFPPEFAAAVSDYPINILEVHKYLEIENFQSDLRVVFGFLQKKGNSKDIHSFINDNEERFRNLEEDAYDMIAALSGSEELRQLKTNFKNEKGEVNMCQAIKELIEGGRMSGKTEGIQLGLTRGIVESRQEDVLALLSEIGKVPEALIQKVKSEQDPGVLKSWLLLVFRVKSVKEFQENA